MGTDFIDIGLSGGNSGSRSVANFNISNNGTVAVPMSNCAGIGIGFGNTGYATMEMVLNNNVMVLNNTVASSGIGGGNGIVTSNTENPDLTITATNNNISQVDGNGILVVGRGVSGTLKTGIRNNTVSAPLTGVRPGIRVDAGNASSLDDAVCADISANTTGGSGGHQGIGVRKQGGVATTNDFNVEGFGGSTCSQVEDYIAGLNPGSATAPAITACDGATLNKRVLAISGSVFGSCNTAPAPPPGWEEMRFQEAVLGPYFVLERPLPPGAVVTPEMIDEEIEIPSLRPWWTEQMERIERGELPEVSTSQNILETSDDVDAFATGDPYQNSINRHNALVAAIKNGQVQGATGEAIVAEAETDDTGVLQSIRKAVSKIFSTVIPTASAQNVTEQKGKKLEAPQSGESINLTIGTLPPSKSVTINFNVTFDGPSPSTEIITRVVNQATISGSNFANVLTSDPAPSGDPACTGVGTATCTPVDRPDTTVTSINRVTTSPTNLASVQWTVTFANAVGGLTAANLTLNDTTTSCTGESLGAITAGPGANDWTVNANTGTGSCTLRLDVANSTGLSHDVTNLPFITGQTIIVDKLAPSTTSFTRFNPATSSTNADTLVFRATFSEDVTNVDAADFSVTGTTATVSLVTPFSASVYDITVSGGDLASLNGTVGLNFSGAMDITDAATNALPNTDPVTDQTYLVDNSAPTVNIVDVTPDPRNTAVASIAINFSEDVTGFEIADLTLTRDAGANLLPGGASVTGGPANYTLGTTTAVTTPDGAYVLTLSAPGGITDAAGNALVIGDTDSWVMDAAAPTVTINQASGQSDPTFQNPINFTAIFNEPVTDFDDAADVAITGTAAGVVTATKVITPVSTTEYTIAVSGITGDGTVIANIPAGVAVDAATNSNVAATFTDNTVTFVTCVPPPPNMLAWYTGDGTTRDIAGGNDGTLANGAAYGAGKVGQAFDFNTANAVVTAPGNTILNISGTGLTLDGWIYPRSNVSGTFYFAKSATSDHPYVLYNNGGDIHGIIRTPVNNFEFDTNIAPALNTWTHIALVFDSTQAVAADRVKVYINGTAATLTASGGFPAQNSNLASSTLPFAIGNRATNPGVSFNGLIDEVEVFNRALAESEIDAIFAADGGGKCKPFDLRIDKEDVGAPFDEGAAESYTIVVTNDGPATTSGTQTVTDTFPVGLTPGAATGTNWTCNTALQVVTCTSTEAVTAGNVFPTITVPVTVAQNAAPSVSNTATVATSPATGELDTSDNSDTEVTVVNGVALTPSVTNATTNEDTQTTSGLVISRNINDGNEVTHFKITAITNGTLFQNNGTTPIANNEFITFAQGNAGLKFTPNANFFGNGSFQVQASVLNADGGIGGGTVTATITVTAVADTPSVTNATTNEDIQTTSGLVISRNAGDGAEVTHFQITGITNGSLFLNDGTTAIANGDFVSFAQGNAGLRFTPAANFFGDGSFQVQSSLSNTVGGLGGGLATATITVNAVADTPSVTDATTVEDTQTTSGLVISRSAADSSEVTHFKITAITNGTLFLNDGTTPVANNTFVTFAQGNAGLKFTPSANFFGNGTFQIQASTSNADAGLGGGVITATITVNAVADTPSVTNATTNEDVQTTSGLVISRNAADGNEVTHFKITAITNGTLFQNDGTTAIANGAFITFAQGNAGLKFTPNANFFGNGTFQIQASVSNADAGLGGGVITATITVNPVADTPSATDATTNEDTQTTSGLAISRNAADGAEVTHFKITNITNGTLFQNDGVTPIASNAFITFAQGNAGLKFTPSANFFGNGTFQVQASLVNNDGGLGGGVITVTITVNPVADTPSVTNSTTNEDIQTTSGLVVSRNAADGTEVTHFKITAITNGTLFLNDGTTPISNNAFITFAQANAGLKFTPAANLFSPTTTFSFQVQASISNADAGLGGGVVTATITVDPVADTPSVTNATTVHGAQTTSGLVVSRNAVDGAEVTHFKITNVTNGALFQNNGTTPIADNTFITFAQANAGLRFTPNIGFIGTATFQIQASVSNVDAGLGGGVITANIVVNKADTTTTVVSSLNPSPLGTPVTFTSTTVITPPGQGPINGTVNFLDGASPITGCQGVAVNGAGQAQCTTSTLTSGSHVITAQYLGSATFNTSSGTLTQVVDLPPTAAGTAPTVVTGGGTTHTVTVTYTDDFAINVASLDSNDIRVTGPNAFNSTVTFTGVNINTNGTPRVATYTFNAPGGSWDLGDNGTYSIVMQANQVVDSADQPVAAGSIGTFVVDIPPVTISGNIRQYVAGGPNTPLAGVTVTLTSNNVPVPGPATTNANGDYVITNVSHGANVVVTSSGLGKVYDPLTRTFNNVTTNTTADFIAYDANAIPRTIKVVDTYPVPGAAVAVPIVMNSQGTETLVSFSLNYSINPLASNPTATCGAATIAGCTVTFNNTTPGQIGVTITNPLAFTAGPAEIAVINFQTLANNLGNTPLTFGDAPVVRLVTDGDGNPLPATYINGLMVFAQGQEGDVANRNTGNGAFEPADIVQMRRFVAGLDAPVGTNNEFQRADTAPASTKGDGNLNSTDLVQARRYIAGLDASQSAGGRGVANAGPIAPPVMERSSGTPAAEITIGKASGSTESRVSVPVGMRSNGDEVALNFVVRYDATRLGNATVQLANAPNGATLTANTDEPGVIRVLVDSSGSFARSSAIETLVNISFDIASTAPTGDTHIRIDETTISDTRAASLAVKTTNGTISIAGPNAVSVEISGRVLTPNGSGLRNATVNLTDANGVTRTARTATFGYYRFDGLSQGASYTLTVSSRRFRFVQQRVTPSDNLTGIDFTGQE